jgi:hypothetical protein
VQGLVRTLQDVVERVTATVAHPLERVRDNVQTVTFLLTGLYREALLRDPRRADPRALARHGWRAFSQFDEDGIIEEVFRRLPPATRTFVEVGAGDGTENNTRLLLAQGWRGAWVEADAACVATARRRRAAELADGRLRIIDAFVTAETIDDTLATAGVPEEVDLLSVDVDGNDYWLWRALRRLRPRVVVIEHNATFGPRARIVTPYDPGFVWDKTSHFGASLAAFAELGAEKGYALVGCGLAGLNAFFVRQDLVGDRFLVGGADAHWEPPRYYLRLGQGHSPRW